MRKILAVLLVFVPTVVRADDARNMRPMTIAVIGISVGDRNRAVQKRAAIGVVGVTDEVPAGEHAAPWPEAAAEIWILVVDAGVHDRDLGPMPSISRQTVKSHFSDT